MRELKATWTVESPEALDPLWAWRTGTYHALDYHPDDRLVIVKVTCRYKLYSSAGPTKCYYRGLILQGSAHLRRLTPISELEGDNRWLDAFLQTIQLEEQLSET